MAQTFIEKMNQKAASVKETWQSYQENRNNSTVDFSKLFESDNKRELRKAIKNLEEDRR